MNRYLKYFRLPRVKKRSVNRGWLLNKRRTQSYSHSVLNRRVYSSEIEIFYKVIRKNLYFGNEIFLQTCSARVIDWKMLYLIQHKKKEIKNMGMTWCNLSLIDPARFFIFDKWDNIEYIINRLGNKC